MSDVADVLAFLSVAYEFSLVRQAIRMMSSTTFEQNSFMLDFLGAIRRQEARSTPEVHIAHSIQPFVRILWTSRYYAVTFNAVQRALFNSHYLVLFGGNRPSGLFLTRAFRLEAFVIHFGYRGLFSSTSLRVMVDP